MFNRAAYRNSRPGGIGVLQVVGTGGSPSREGRRSSLVEKLQRLRPDRHAPAREEAPEGPPEQRFVPLRRTELRGEIVGPLASLTLVHTYGYTSEQCDQVLQALYRFPLPGDAAVTGVRVRFGEVEIATRLEPREEAEEAYGEALEEGKQAALLTRESPDVFTLRVAGIRPDEDVVVETDYVQLARPQARQAGWQLRVPLTTAPRYVREDELTSRHAQGQPLALLRDPGHRFALDLRLRDVDQVASPTHALDLTSEGAGGSPHDRRVRLDDSEVVPDRDLVLAWTLRRGAGQEASAAPELQLHLHHDEDDGHLYFLALVAPPAAHEPGTGAAREIVLLVDHSGSMSGAKWEAADWTVNSFLGTLTERDRFSLGLFHTTTTWFHSEPRRATDENLRAAVRFLDENRDAGGTNLGVALEQALRLPRSAGEGDLARHVLIVTDAQVSDAPRLFRLADQEARRDDARRISLICIDAAPNSFLANELAERGGGVAHFLTSSPDEEDVTTALEGVLADWAEPVLVDLRLTVDWAGVRAAGRQVKTTDDATVIDVGDLPRGRAVWVVGCMSAEEKPGGLTFRLATATESIATHRTDAEDAGASLPALKPLFGARKLLALEHLIHARYAVEDLPAQVARLGYDPDRLDIGGDSVYAENALRSAQEALTPVLIEESLRYGIACAETSFVAVREEAGERVGATTVVANALPAGWSDAFLSQGMAAVAPSMRATMGPAGAVAQKSIHFAVVRDAGAPSQGIGGLSRVFSGVPRPADGEAVLYDAAARDELPDEALLTRLSVRFDAGPPPSVDRGLELLIYVGDPAMPRATVRLADLVRAGSGRPLNLRRSGAEMVRIVLVDPNGAWASGGPALTVELAWRHA